MMEREIKDDIICLSMQLLMIHEFNSVFRVLMVFLILFTWVFIAFFYPFLFFLKGPFSIVASFLQKN